MKESNRTVDIMIMGLAVFVVFHLHLGDIPKNLQI